MEEIYRLATRITVLRDGRVVTSALPGELPESNLIEAMIGRKIERVSPGLERVTRRVGPARSCSARAGSTVPGALRNVELSR